MCETKRRYKTIIMTITFVAILALTSFNGKVCYGASGSMPPDTFANIFVDPNFAEAVRKTLGAPFDSINSTVTQDELNKVTYLAVVGKNITDITGIGYLTNLKYIDLSNNQITTVPQEIVGLVNLEILTLSNNSITEISVDTFGSLSKLQKINLDNNKLSNISKLGSVAGTCIINCSNQVIGNDLGTLDTNRTYTLPVTLPQIFTSQSLSVVSGTATITTDAVGNKIANVSVGSVGNNSVIVRINSDNPDNPINVDNTTYTITFNVTNSYQLKIPIISATLNNSFTTNLRPTIFGTAIPGSYVMVLTDNKEDLNLVTVSPLGTWSYTPADNLLQGKHLFTAKAKDILNIWSDTSTAVSITIDTTPPVKPVITATLNNLMTNNTTPKITGTAEANAIITLTVDTIDYYDCTNADTTGKWSYTFASPLLSGNHVISARARDLAGNWSAKSNPINITIDLIPPQTPLIDATFNGILLNSSKPTFTGTGEIGSKIGIYLYIDSVLSVTSSTVDSNGKWKYTPNTILADGTHSICAFAKDSAGNNSYTSTVFSFRIDTVAPKVPVILTPTNSLVTNISKPFVSGKSDIDTIVMVFVDGKPVSDKLSVNYLGDWACTPITSITDGIHKITAKAYDAANNESIATTPTLITIKTAAPQKPVINAKLNKTITNNRSIVINGTADPKVWITVNIDGIDRTDCTTSDSTGKWSYTPDYYLADGEHIISARAKDVFNNIGLFSSNITVTIDTVAPSEPIITPSLNGTLLNSLKPEITGTAEIGVSIIVIIDGQATIKAVNTDSKGTWKYVPPTNLLEGTHQISAKAVDKAGNSSPIGTQISIIINVTPPSIPRILLPGNNSVSNNSKLSVSGQADVYTKILVYIDNTEIGNVDADASGNWMCTPVEAIKDGKHNITVKAKNKANNISAASLPITVIIDTTPPKAPSITTPQNNITTSNQKLTIIGNSEVGSKITVSVDGVEFIDCATADSTGKWTYTLANLVSIGGHTISAKAKDGLGNLGEFGNRVFITIDMSSPIVVINEIGTSNFTNDQQPTIYGTVKPNSMVFLHIDDKDISKPIIADNDGNWKYKISVKLVEGNHAISGKATDSAGNSSLAATQVKFVVDLSPPIIPEIKIPQDKVILNNQNPEISGKGEVDSNINIFVDNKLQEDIAQVDGDGNWMCQLSNGLTEGKHIITAKAKDIAGNSSKSSSSTTITIDTIPPSIPRLIAPINGAVYKTSKIVVVGKGEKNSLLVLSIDNMTMDTNVSVNEKGDFSYAVQKNLSVGQHTVTVATKDAIGNISATTLAAIKISTTTVQAKPKPTIISKPKNNSKTKDKRPYISGNSNPNSIINVRLSFGKTTVVLSTKSNKSGNWTLRPKKNLIPGKYKAIAVAKLQNSKQTITSKPITFTILK